MNYENGNLVGGPGNGTVWTSTNPDGTLRIMTIGGIPQPPNHCNNWSSNTSAYQGWIGIHTSTGYPSWSAYSERFCSGNYHFYCFEQ